MLRLQRGDVLFLAHVTRIDNELLFFRFGQHGAEFLTQPLNVLRGQQENLGFRVGMIEVLDEQERQFVIADDDEMPAHLIVYQTLLVHVHATG